MEPNIKNPGNRQQEITEISRSLKMMAKELSVPVIALSQLSRLVTGRKGQRPMLSDLRESGAIEQDADIVMFIHRPDLAPDMEREKLAGEIVPNMAEIIFEKNRSGERGDTKLLFKGEYSKFVTPVKGDIQPPSDVVKKHEAEQARRMEDEESILPEEPELPPILEDVPEDNDPSLAGLNIDDIFGDM